MRGNKLDVIVDVQSFSSTMEDIAKFGQAVSATLQLQTGLMAWCGVLGDLMQLRKFCC